MFKTQHYKSLFFLDISFDDIGSKLLVLSQRVFMGGHVNCSVIMINGFLAGKLVPAYTGWCMEKQQGRGVGTTPFSSLYIRVTVSLTVFYTIRSTLPVLRAM